MTRRTARNSTSRPTGSGSVTDRSHSVVPRRRGRSLLAPAVCALLLCAAPAHALDVFTLWSRPELPLSLAPGARADYRTQTLETGRRSDDALRVQCVAEDVSGWWVELLPLVEVEAGVLAPAPGEGWRLHLGRGLLERRGDLAAHVLAVEQWQEGRGRVLDPAEWREDPLVQSSLRSEFVPDERSELEGTMRVVGGRELPCAHYLMAAADTTLLTLPRGELRQIHRREITAAVNADVPFLGLAYAAERSETRSTLVPEGSRKAPRPEIRVEIMELVGFGNDAAPVLVRP